MNGRKKLFSAVLAIGLLTACDGDVSAPARPQRIQPNIQSVNSTTSPQTHIPVDTVRVTGRGRTRYAMGAN